MAAQVLVFMFLKLYCLVQVKSSMCLSRFAQFQGRLPMDSGGAVLGGTV